MRKVLCQLGRNVREMDTGGSRDAKESKAQRRVWENWMRRAVDELFEGDLLGDQRDGKVHA